MSESAATKPSKITVSDLMAILGQYDGSMRVVVKGFDEYGFCNASVRETMIGGEDDGSFADFKDGDIERAILIDS